MEALLDKNVTTTLLLWPLGFSFHELEYFGMVEAFINDKHRPSYFGYFIYILVDNRKYNDVPQKTFSSEHLDEKYTYGEFFTVYKYKFPKEFQDDYEKIIAGKYSMLSENYIEIIPEQVACRNDRTGRRFIATNRIKELVTRQWYIKQEYEKLLARELQEDEEWWKLFNPADEVLDILKYLYKS